MSNRDTILEKVRALLEKQENHATTEAEAAAVAARVASLMDRHGITEAELRHVQSEIRDHPYRPKYADPWRRSIVFAVARLYCCRALNDEHIVLVRSRRTGKTKYVVRKSFVFYGLPHQTAVCESMCDYLFGAVTRLARDHSPVRSSRLAFERGCGEALADRIYTISIQRDQKQEKDVSAARDSGQTEGLPALFSDQLTVVKNWMSENVKTESTRHRGSQSLDNLSAMEGALAAQEIQLADQVGSDGGPVRALESR